MRYLTFLSLILFIGCKSINISKANKKLYKKGIQSGKDYVDYSVNVTSKKAFYVENISIVNSSKKIDFFYKNLESGESSYKMMTPFTKGNYLFKFRLNDVDSMAKEEVLLFEYSIDGNKKQQKIPIVNSKEIGIKK